MGRQDEMAVLVTLGLLVLSFETTLGQKYKPLTGTAGQAVIIQCGSSRDGCSWSKDGTRLSLDERSDQARFRSASCDLTIEPLLPGDEGKYDCNNGQSRHHLRVQVEAGVPYIEEGRQSMVLDVQEGRQAELHCVSRGGRVRLFCREPSGDRPWDDLTEAEEWSRHPFRHCRHYLHRWGSPSCCHLHLHKTKEEVLWKGSR